MKLRFTPRATQDLAAIADYIRAHNPAAAQRVRAHPETRRTFLPCWMD